MIQNFNIRPGIGQELTGAWLDTEPWPLAARDRTGSIDFSISDVQQTWMDNRHVLMPKEKIVLQNNGLFHLVSLFLFYMVRMHNL